VPVFGQRIRFNLLVCCAANFASIALADPRIIFVNQSATGSNQGTSWQDAYLDLQDALQSAQFGDQIWVAAGKYTPDRGTKDRKAFFSIPDGVELYGGFVGTETDPSQRDCLTNETVLTGDLNGDDLGIGGPPFNPGASDCFCTPDLGFGCSDHPDTFGCDDPVCEARVCAIMPECCGSNPTQYPHWVWGCARQAELLCCAFDNTCENSFNIVEVIDDIHGVTIDGLTISGAYGSPLEEQLGTGLEVLNSSMNVSNVIVRANTNYAIGATGSPRLNFTDCEFVSNAGVGLTIDSVATMKGCTFTDDISGLGVYGGGLTIIDSDLRATRFPSTLLTVIDAPLQMGGSRINQPRHAWALNIGGYSGASSAFITDTVFQDTFASAMLGPTNATITKCRFLNARQAIYAESSYLLIRDTAFDAIGIDGQGGTIYDDGSNVVIDHCTFIDTHGYDNSLGSVITLDYGARAGVHNSIIWDPRMYSYYGEIVGEKAAFYSFDDSSTLIIDNSIVQGWTGALGGNGNSGSVPMFVDPSGADGILGTEDDDLRLSPGSPAINAGLPSIYLTPSDLDGHPRILCGRTDIGAYEFGIGDFDCNQSFNIADLVGWPNCSTGPLFAPPGRPAYSPPCAAFDFDADGDVDLHDFSMLQQVFVTP